MAGFQKNDTDFDESQIGEKAHITLSPLAKSRLITHGPKRIFNGLDERSGNHARRFLG